VLLKIRPAVDVKGGDDEPDQMAESAVPGSLGAEIVPHNRGISTTSLIGAK